MQTADWDQQLEGAGDRHVTFLIINHASSPVGHRGSG
jgi:hypothetical protein